ncbi:hypothetical protein M4I33_08120 [Clostridium sp. LY3-2]|uniref:hypothetical protein n=1 Tax=Clostridium sp. LY3-2 TaxID=2942482 RepID=UPI0021523CF6|nr:hypothetical protein [Clostridium sp. LY3-2]MCR6514846.1 hypothetical protein [Clostridium sp. LY3-2]
MNTKKLILSSLVCFSFIIGMVTIPANATPNEEDSDYISLSKLTTSKEGTITNPSKDTVEYKFSDNIIKIDFTSPFININDKIIPLETEEINGLKLPSFKAKFKRNEENQIIIKSSLIKDTLNIELNNAEKKENEEETENTNDLTNQAPEENTNQNVTTNTRPNQNNSTTQTRPNNRPNRPSGNTGSNTNNNGNNSNNKPTKPVKPPVTDDNNESNDNNSNGNDNSNNNDNSNEDNNTSKPDTGGDNNSNGSNSGSSNTSPEQETQTQDNSN